MYYTLEANQNLCHSSFGEYREERVKTHFLASLSTQVIDLL